MTRSLRFGWAAAGALVWLLASAPLALAQGSWAMSEAACVGTTRRDDDVSWPPTASWDGLGVSTGHDVSGDAWASECFEVTLCRPRIMRFRINDIDHRPGHNSELWIDGRMIGATPKLGTWGMLVCKLGKYMTASSNGDWKIGFGRGGPGVDVQLPHTDGQVHQIRVRFGGYDGHTQMEVHDSCMTLPNCEIKWDWVTPKVVVKGKFAYRDSLISPAMPMRSIKLSLFDQNANGTYRYLGVDGSTDSVGNFRFPCIDNVDDDGTLLDLMVRAYFESDSSRFPQPFSPPIVKPVRMLDRNNAIWSFDSETKVNSVGVTTDHSELDFGTQKPATTDYRRNSAMHIYTTMLRGWDWVKLRTKWQDPVNPELMGKTTVVWDWEYQDTSFTFGDSIVIAGKGNRAGGDPDEWDDDILLHEYGHRVANRYFFSSSAQIANHSYSSQVIDVFGNPSPGGAWDEGWAHFFSRAVWNSSAGATRQNVGWDKNSTTRSKETINLEDGRYRFENPIGSLVQSGTYNNQGATWEVPVAGVLWDMYDDQYKSDNQPGNACGEAYWEDSLHTKIFKACLYKVPAPVSDIYSFYNAYVQLNPDTATASKLRDLFCEHGITVPPQHAPGQIAKDPPPIVSADPMFTNDLLPGRPNPCRVGTTIDFSLAIPARVDLEVFDVRGRRVQSLLHDQARDPGRYSVAWNGRDVSGNAVRPGVYFYRLVTNGFRAERKLIVIP